jgi:hypothetical protein
MAKGNWQNAELFLHNQTMFYLTLKMVILWLITTQSFGQSYSFQKINSGTKA